MKSVNELAHELIEALASGQPAVSGPVPAHLRLAARAVTVAAQDPVIGLDEVDQRLRGLHSVQRYRAEPVAMRDILAAIADGLAADSRLHPAEGPAGNGIEVLALARRITGAAPGVHLVSGMRSEWLGELDRDTWLSLFNNDGFAQAPVLLLVLGSPGAAWHRAGPIGYMSLLRRAGIVAHRTWLRALGEGLSGGLVESPEKSIALSRLAGLDPQRRRCLLGLVIGYREDSAIEKTALSRRQRYREDRAIEKPGRSDEEVLVAPTGFEPVSPP